jgi:hypothetical protein
MSQLPKGERIEFKDLKDGMDVVVHRTDMFGPGATIRGRVVFHQRSFDNGYLEVATPNFKTIFDSDNIWLVS